MTENPVRKAGSLQRVRSAQRGFTVIEALVAIVVVTLAVVGMLGAVPASFAAAQQAAYRVQAVAVAQQYLDAVRQYVQTNGNASLPAGPTIAIDAGTSMTGNGVAATSPGNFSLTNNSCPLVAGSTRSYDCSVTGTWTQSGASKTVTIETYVTKQ